MSGTRLLPKVLTVAACHLGTLGAVWSIFVKLADNYIPYSLVNACPFLEDCFGLVMKMLDIFIHVLAFPLLLLSVTFLEHLPCAGRFVIGMGAIGNSLLWGFLLVRFVHLRRRPRRAETAGDDPAITDKTLHHACSSGLRRTTTVLMTAAYPVVIMCAGPLRWLWGWRIATALGINPDWIMQRISTTWDNGALVELFLDISFFVAPPALAVILCRRAPRGVIYVVLAWFASIVWYLLVR